MINSYTTYIKQTMVSTLLQKEHEFEHRRWIPEWGPKQPPEPAVGGSENWQVIMEPAPAADDPFSDNSSCRGRQDGASFGTTCLSYSSISCTHGMPVTFTMNGSRSSSAASPHEVKAARARARARARAAKKASARPRHGGVRVRKSSRRRLRTHPECLCLPLSPAVGGKCLPLSPAVGGNDLPEPAGACAERAEIVAIVVDKKATAAVVEWQ